MWTSVYQNSSRNGLNVLNTMHHLIFVYPPTVIFRSVLVYAA